MAKRLEVDFTGTLGVIHKAKATGYIDKIKPVINKLKATNFRIADKTHIIPLEFADKEEEVLPAPVTVSEGDEPLW